MTTTRKTYIKKKRATDKIRTSKVAAESRIETFRINSVRRIMRRIMSPVSEDVIFCQRYSDCLNKCESGGDGKHKCDIEWFETRCPLLAAALESRVNRVTATRCAASNRARLNSEPVRVHRFSMDVKEIVFLGDGNTCIWDDATQSDENAAKIYEMSQEARQ